MKYDIADNIIAFSTERDEELPFYVVQPHQVHGTVIREVTDPMTTRKQLEGVDALITNIPGVAISVRTADCIPVLLYDPVHKAIAAVHDGWRGTVQRLSQKVIAEMQLRYGDKIGIMSGGGINLGNVKEILDMTGAVHCHASLAHWVPRFNEKLYPNQKDNTGATMVWTESNRDLIYEMEKMLNPF